MVIAKSRVVPGTINEIGPEAISALIATRDGKPPRAIGYKDHMYELHSQDPDSRPLSKRRIAFGYYRYVLLY